MGRTGKDTRMKSLAAPPTYKVRRSRSGSVFVSKPKPGPHPVELSVSLYTILRNLLGVTHSIKESVGIIKSGKISIDSEVVYETKRPVGLMDVFTMKGVEEKYRMLITRHGYLDVVKVPTDEEAVLKPCRIMKKTMGKGGQIKFTFHDGREIKIAPELTSLVPGDSVLLQLPSREVKEVARLTTGSLGYVFKGRSAGVWGTVEGLRQPGLKKPSMVQLRTADNTQVTTIREYVFIIGSQSPWISVAGV